MPAKMRNPLIRHGMGLAFASACLSAVACDPSSTTRTTTPVDSAAITGRLTARVTSPPTGTVPTGLTVQTLTAGGRPFGLYVPTTYDPARNWPVTVLLHGENGSGEGMVLDFKDDAEAQGVVVLAPNSASSIWDLILNSQFGVDRTYIDDMLKWAFAHVAADPARVSISGFSYGGTYALWLGLKNGDLFSRIAAFTPCSAVPSIRTGLPSLFISHATDDQVAPVATCSRVTVASLDSAGYTVDYVEYAALAGNGHVLTPAVRTQGMVFLAHQ